MVSLTLIVSGFAFVTPSLNALISRRSDPLRQGGILGVGQSASALARILGSALGIPLLMTHAQLPLFTAALLMSGGLLLILWSARSGRDFAVAAE
jgi:hypothetical protein